MDEGNCDDFEDLLFQMKLIGTVALALSAAAIGGVIGLVWVLS